MLKPTNRHIRGLNIKMKARIEELKKLIGNEWTSENQLLREELIYWEEVIKNGDEKTQSKKQIKRQKKIL